MLGQFENALVSSSLKTVPSVFNLDKFLSNTTTTNYQVVSTVPLFTTPFNAGYTESSIYFSILERRQTQSSWL